ncbi:MAG: MBL fold metallo-hydrolase [Verrucomicrobiia bacterium]
MALRRRDFLRYSAGAGIFAALAASGWVASSQNRAARWLRHLVRDSQRDILSPAQKPDPASWEDNAITLSWLGHATVLINFYGFRILTDPALCPRVGVWLRVGTLGPKRYIAPALTVKELPPVDLVLLSHAHMDHMDLATLRHLRATPATVTSRETTEIVRKAGLENIQELDWKQRTTVSSPRGDLEILAFEVKHWGRRWPDDINRGYNGYVLRREGKSLVFGGDTAKTRLFGNIRSEGKHSLAIMPIAAYNPWIWSHCTPEEAVRMANEAGADYIVPVHHETFKLSDEPMTEPMERLQACMASEPERLALRAVGETFTLA